MGFDQRLLGVTQEHRTGRRYIYNLSYLGFYLWPASIIPSHGTFQKTDLSVLRGPSLSETIHENILTCV